MKLRFQERNDKNGKRNKNGISPKRTDQQKN